MKPFKSITAILLLLLLLGGCARQSYSEEELTNAMPMPVIETANPLVSETVPATVPDESNPIDTTANWETLYTAGSPVTDSQELIRILEVLKGRFLKQFDRPGWYQLKWLNHQTNWIHISDPSSSRFDSVINYSEHEKYPEGFLNPESYLSLDGHYGRMISPTLDDFHFVPLTTQPPEIVWENLDYYLACDFCVASEHLDFLIQWIRDPDNHISEKSLKETHFSGWVGTYKNQPVFISKIKIKYFTNYPYIDTGELVEIEDNSFYISLANGGTIAENSDVFFLGGGEKLNDLLPYNLQQIAYFETLPERVQTLYDECYKKLIEFEEQN